METRKYKSDLTEALGSGSYSSVYLGRSKEDPNIKVAVKEIKNDVKQTGHFSDSAKREVAAMQKACDNINVMPMLDFDATNRFIYIVMEYCEHGDLEAYAGARSLSLEQKLDLMMQCANGVAYLHSLQPPIIHRDLKPQNIIIKETSSGEIVKISDFGLSKILEDSSKQYMSTDAGTTAFKAPELFKQGRLQYTASVDVFALGLVFLALVKFDRNRHPTFEPYDKPNEPYLAYGLRLLLCKQKQEPFPTLFEVFLSSESTRQLLTVPMKTLICKMVIYEAVSRPGMRTVFNELKIIVEKVEGSYPTPTQYHTAKMEENMKRNEKLEDTLKKQNKTISALEKQLETKDKELTQQLCDKDKTIQELKTHLVNVTTAQTQNTGLYEVRETVSKQKATLTHSRNQVDYTNLATYRYKVDKQVAIGGVSGTMQISNNQLLCTTLRCLRIYSLQGNLVKTVCFNYGGSTAVSSVIVNSDHFLVADGEKGVFLVKKDGQCDKQLSEGKFSDIHHDHNKVYALEYEQGEVVLFELTDKSWTKSQQITLSQYDKSTSCELDRMSTRNNKTYISKGKSQCVYVYDHQGQLLSTYGEFGEHTARLLNSPLLCDVDSSGTALIADYVNHRLQTCTSTGEWQVISLPQQVQKPTYSVVNSEDQSLWVISDFEILFKMSKV